MFDTCFLIRVISESSSANDITWHIHRSTSNTVTQGAAITVRLVPVLALFGTRKR